MGLYDANIEPRGACLLAHSDFSGLPKLSAERALTSAREGKTFRAGYRA